MPAALDVNREAVKMLAISVGVREAARQMGLPESTVKSWSDRGEWLKKPVQPPTVLRASNASKPSDCLANTIADDGLRTRVGFAKAARKVAVCLGEKEPDALVERDTAQAARNWTDVASKVHGWGEKQDAGVNVAVNIGILGG